MRLTIQNNYGKFDKNIWVRDSEKLDINILHTFSSILDLYAIVNGKTQKVVNNRISLSTPFNDEYNIKIKVTLNGKVLKNVLCETLKIVQLHEDEKVVLPEISNLELELNKVKSNFTQQIKELKEQNELLKVENERLKQFIQNDIGEEDDE